MVFLAHVILVYLLDIVSEQSDLLGIFDVFDLETQEELDAVVARPSVNNVTADPEQFGPPANSAPNSDDDDPDDYRPFTATLTKAHALSVAAPANFYVEPDGTVVWDTRRSSQSA